MKKLIIFIFLLIFTCSQAFAQQYRPGAVKMHNKGVEYYDKHQYQNALDCFLEAIAIDPNFMDSYYNLAVLYEYFGEKPKAIAAYKNLLKIDAYNPEAAYKVGELSAEQKNYKVAITYLNLVPKNSARYASAQDLKRKLQGKVALEKEQYDRFYAQEQQTYTGVPSPSGICQDKNGQTYITNSATNSITIITDKNERKFFFRGAPLSAPMGIISDKYNNLYVASSGNGKIIYITQDKEARTILSGLSRPEGLFLNEDNVLFITQKGKNTVTRYKLY